MKFFTLLSILLCMVPPISLYAQHEKNEAADTSSLLHAFKKGITEGHFRLYYMTTNNDDPLTDYYALAFGGGLKYQTKSYKGFQLGVGGFFIWNLASSDLTVPDPHTGIMNRYEIGQFDQANPANKKDMQRLEDFFIRYNFKNSFIRFGKQVIKTPFINPQDGRMRPTGEQGFWSEINEIKNTKIEAGWLTHISPRGTVRWYRGASSLGIYPPGIAISGAASNYKNNVHSKGIAIAGITHQPSQTFTLQAWDFWVENIFNTVLLQADAGFSFSENEKIISGIQYIHQEAVNDGGHADPVKTYFDPSQTSNLISLRAGYQKNRSAANLNYTRITGHGRFLFPREWGREPLYTFIPRERNEGLGDVHAYTVNLSHELKKPGIDAGISYGYFDVPDVKNFRLNKYGFPSWHQLNVHLKYSFEGFLTGLNAEVLYLYKKRSGTTYDELKYVIHKVDMHQLNIIMNYNF